MTSFENKDISNNMIFQINTTTRFSKALVLQCQRNASSNSAIEFYDTKSN